MTRSAESLRRELLCLRHCVAHEWTHYTGSAPNFEGIKQWEARIAELEAALVERVRRIPVDEAVKIPGAEDA